MGQNKIILHTNGSFGVPLVTHNHYPIFNGAVQDTPWDKLFYCQTATVIRLKTVGYL